MPRVRARFLWGSNMKRLLTLLLLVSLNALALDHHMMTITNDSDDEILKFVVETDEQNTELQTMIKKVYDGSMNYQGRDVYDAESVLSRGAVLTEMDGRKVVILKVASNFKVETGGVLTLDYLYNGITGSRKSFQFTMSRSGDTWKVSKGGKKIKKLHFVTNKKPIVGTIGIKEIKSY